MSSQAEGAVVEFVVDVTNRSADADDLQNFHIKRDEVRVCVHEHGSP